MKIKKKILAILGIKGLLAVSALMTIAMALVVYTAAVTVNPTQQLTIGATSASWTVYVNDVNQVRYLPNGFTEPTLNTDDSSTYAFKTATDANKVCAIKIELTSAIDGAKFSNYNIAIRSSTGGAWSDETIYVGATGATTKSYINGLTGGEVGYIHQIASTTKYYEIKVTYSYDKVDSIAQVTSTFQYTPLPQDSFS